MGGWLARLRGVSTPCCSSSPSPHLHTHAPTHPTLLLCASPPTHPRIHPPTPPGLVLAPSAVWIGVASALIISIWQLNGKEPLYPVKQGGEAQ